MPGHKGSKRDAEALLVRLLHERDTGETTPTIRPTSNGRAPADLLWATPRLRFHRVVGHRQVLLRQRLGRSEGLGQQCAWR